MPWSSGYWPSDCPNTNENRTHLWTGRGLRFSTDCYRVCTIVVKREIGEGDRRWLPTFHRLEVLDRRNVESRRREVRRWRGQRTDLVNADGGQR